jgi:hypothetical protein
MAQENASPRKKIQEVIRANGLNPSLYVVLENLPNTIIVKHRITGAIKVLDK